MTKAFFYYLLMKSCFFLSWQNISSLQQTTPHNYKVLCEFCQRKQRELQSFNVVTLRLTSRSYSKILVSSTC